MYLVLALFLQSAVAPMQPSLPARTELISAYDLLVTLTTQMVSDLPARLGVDPKQPSLGFTMRTAEMGKGFDGLPQRYTFVVAVFRGTPAFEAGVRPGDRIAAIGIVECDTLAPKAVFFYMGEHPDALPLTLERNGQRFAISVRRAPLPCAEQVWQQFPVELWRARITTVQMRVMAVRDAMAHQELTEQQTLNVMSAYSEAVDLIQAQLEEMSRQLNPALSPLCEKTQ